MSLKTGDKLGPYEVIAPLGKGGMGEVYRALDARVHREVAVSAGGGVFPRWSADGTRLFYLTLSGDVMTVDVQAGASFQHSAPQRLFGNVAPAPWSLTPAGDRFLVSRTSVGAGPPPPFTMVLNWMGRLRP